jgi:hypothetical protein
MKTCKEYNLPECCWCKKSRELPPNCGFPCDVAQWYYYLEKQPIEVYMREMILRTNMPDVYLNIAIELLKPGLKKLMVLL